jgi:hypothetical protein
MGNASVITHGQVRHAPDCLAGRVETTVDPLPSKGLEIVTSRCLDCGMFISQKQKPGDEKS